MLPRRPIQAPVYGRRQLPQIYIPDAFIDVGPGGYRWPSGLRGVISSNLVFARVSDNPRQAVLLE